MIMIKKLIARLLPYMPKKLVWLFSKRYIAGENLSDAIRVSKELNSQGIKVTIDLLGEYITKMEEAQAYLEQYLEIIDTASQNKIDGNFSIKPSMFGLLLDKEACYNNIRKIVMKAASYNAFVRIDMEDSLCVDAEIDIFRRLKVEFPKNVGLVVQSYMRRTLDDLKNLLDLHSNDNPLNYRLCKGIYIEPEKIAYKGYQEVRNHFLEDLDFLFKHGVYPGIATHDKYLIEGAYKLILQYKVPKVMYEFQMLYGVRPDLRKSIVDEGHVMRVYVPFGKHWFGYSTRRLKENPNMVWHILKALVVRG
jgi:proline dehydrogenase